MRRIKSRTRSRIRPRLDFEDWKTILQIVTIVVLAILVVVVYSPGAEKLYHVVTGN